MLYLFKIITVRICILKRYNLKNSYIYPESKIKIHETDIRIWQWIPYQRRKQGRPPHCWIGDVIEAMETRGLNEGDWNNCNPWILGSEKRRQP